LVDISNAIALRYDAGIVKHKYEHTGVVEVEECTRLGNVFDDEKYTGGNFGGNVWDDNALAPTMKTGASASQQCTVEIKQATKDGYIECEMGGGSRSQLSVKPNKAGKSPRERSDMSYADNGEYP